MVIGMDKVVVLLPSAVPGELQGWKSVYAHHSQMSELYYTVEPEVECPNDDPNDAAFVRATATIEGRDAVE
jgi:hypothetical protein